MNGPGSTPLALREPVLRRFTVRKAVALLRYLSLRIRYRNLHAALFFLDRGGDILLGPDAVVHIGRKVHMMRDFTGRFVGTLRIADNVFFNRGCYVAAYSCVTIGKSCLFGEGVSIHDENHRTAQLGRPIARQGFETKPIVIGDNVWVGAKATILPGVQIGDHAVIGANAVVTHDVPPYSLAVGVPARVVRLMVDIAEQPLD
ncbi:MAG TPA: acyltransferase [Ktedonobacterales bacterium]|nr:acyltransferase [Ktedonobacterales bacterium]